MSKNANRGGGNPQPQPLTLRLANTPPEKEGGNWQSIVTATLGRGDRAVMNRALLFFLNERPVGTEETDQDGNASMHLTLKPGKNLVRVQIEGTPTTRQITIDVEKPAEKKPAEPTRPVVHYTRDHTGVHHLDIEVLDAEHKPYKGSVQILDSQAPLKSLTLADGHATHTITFASEELRRTVTVTVAGRPDLNFTTTLYKKP